MGQWLSKLFGQNRTHKIVVIGLENAGKTSLVYSLVLGKQVPTQPTLGSNVEEFHHDKLTFVAWDLGGQTFLRPAWSLFYNKSDVVLFVVDSTTMGDNGAKIGEELRRVFAHPELKHACVLVLANKQDLEDAQIGRAHV